MVLCRTLRSHHLYASLKRYGASSLAAREAPRPIRSLSAIFSEPSAAPPPEPEHSAKEEKSCPRRLLASISHKYRPTVEKDFPKELPPEAARLVDRLHKEGYLRNANFYREGEFDPEKVPANLYSRRFLICAAENFGQKHQEIAKWLSGSDLKKVALFGCPSTERKTVFAAKRLRSFFKIHEDIACRGCSLKTSCKFVNKQVGRVENVVLADAMRLLTSYALDSVPHQMSVPNDLKLSVNKLLKEAVNLSES